MYVIYLVKFAVSIAELRVTGLEENVLPYCDMNCLGV
jgi:hypothetical protein